MEERFLKVWEERYEEISTRAEEIKKKQKEEKIAEE